MEPSCCTYTDKQFWQGEKGSLLSEISEVIPKVIQRALYLYMKAEKNKHDTEGTQKPLSGISR